MSRAQFRYIETGTGQLQPNIQIFSGLLGLAVDPSMEKQKLVKPMPSPINRGRGRIGRLLGRRKLQKFGAVDTSMKKQKPAKLMPYPINRGRGHIGRLLGLQNLQKLGAQLEQQFEVTESASLVQPTAGNWFWNVTSSRVLNDVPLRSCSSINSPTESSAVPSACTQPLSRENGVKALDPSMEKQKPANLMPNRINHGRGRIGHFHGPQNLQNLGVAFHEVKSVNNNLTKRGRGRPRGTGNRQTLRAQQQSEIPTILIQPTEFHSNPAAPLQRCSSAQPVLINSSIEASGIPSTCTKPLSADSGLIAQVEQQPEVPKSPILVQPTEIHLPTGICMVSEKEEMMPGAAPLQRCSSAQFILINPSTESSAVPSTCTEPFNGDKGETPGAIQEHIRMNPQPLPEGGQCSNEAKNNKEWDSASVMKAIIRKHGDITKSCKFQSQMFKKNCLESICRIVKKLQETRLTDINPGLLKEFYSFIEDAESVNMDVKWLRKHVDEVEDAMSSAADELKRLEQAEKDLRQENEERKGDIEVKKVEVTKIQSEIWVQEEELALGILSSEDLKAQISCIKSRYHFSDYVRETLT